MNQSINDVGQLTRSYSEIPSTGLRRFWDSNWFAFKGSLLSVDLMTYQISACRTLSKVICLALVDLRTCTLWERGIFFCTYDLSCIFWVCRAIEQQFWGKNHSEIFSTLVRWFRDPNWFPFVLWGSHWFLLGLWRTRSAPALLNTHQLSQIKIYILQKHIFVIIPWLLKVH